jgi:YgiT-type zinc finger domain-containing protein
VEIPFDSNEPSPEDRQHTGQTGIHCTCCGAETREDTVKAAFWGRQGLVAIEDIPARVCQRCGEQFYDDQTARRIEDIVTGSAANPGREVIVPVFSLAAQSVVQEGLREK